MNETFEVRGARRQPDDPGPTPNEQSKELGFRAVSLTLIALLVGTAVAAGLQALTGVNLGFKF